MTKEEHNKEQTRTAELFLASPRKHHKGYAITLYRWRVWGKGEPWEKNCLQYLGPLGWSFRRSKTDEDILPKLHKIEKLKEVTGDDLEAWTFNPNNIYAG